MRVRMSGFTYTLTGGCRLRICLLCLRVAREASFLLLSGMIRLIQMMSNYTVNFVNINIGCSYYFIIVFAVSVGRSFMVC